MAATALAALALGLTWSGCNDDEEQAEQTSPVETAEQGKKQGQGRTKKGHSDSKRPDKDEKSGGGGSKTKARGGQGGSKTESERDREEQSGARAGGKPANQGNPAKDLKEQKRALRDDGDGTSGYAGQGDAAEDRAEQRGG